MSLIITQGYSLPIALANRGAGAPVIRSGTSKFWPMCYAKARDGDLFGFNGMDRPFRWDGIATLAWDAGIDPPVAVPTIISVTAGSGGSTVGQYLFAYRFVDITLTNGPIGSNADANAGTGLPGVPSSLSPIYTLQDTGGNWFAWSLLSASDQAARIGTVEFYQSTSGEAITLYLVGSLGASGTIVSAITSPVTSGKVQYTTTTPHKLAPFAQVLISGTTVSGYNVLATVTSVDSLTKFTTGQTYSSNATGGAWVLTGYTPTSSNPLGLQGTLTSGTDAGGLVVFTTPVPHGLAAGDNVLIQHTTVSGYNAQQLITAVTPLTFTANLGWTSNATGGFYQQVGSAADDTHTAELPYLPILEPDGSVNANRFTPPPTFCPFVLQQQDRIFACGAVEYSEGTITTNGTTTITGVSTHFTPQMVGRWLWIPAEPLPLVIATYASATSLTTFAAATTSTSGIAGYSIRPDPEFRNTLFYTEQNEPESWPEGNTVTVQENTGDDDDITGMFNHGTFVYVLKERHIYRLQYYSQPAVDAGCFLVAARGAVNNRCVVWRGTNAFIMDTAGIYAFDGQTPTDITAEIADLWQDEIIDFTKSKWFWASCDPTLEALYFAVSFVGDTGTRPRHSLVFNLITKTWSVDNYVWDVGGGAIAEDTDGRPRLFVGMESDTILLTGNGLTDIVSTGIVGTVTGSTGNTLSDSTANFTSALLNATIAITAGTAQGQFARITGVNSTTQLVISRFDTSDQQQGLGANWLVNPKAGDTYAIGAIAWVHKTGMMEFPPNDMRTVRNFGLSYDPTAHPGNINLQIFKGYKTLPENMLIPLDVGKGVVSVAGNPNIELNIWLNRYPLGLDNGWKQFVYGGMTDELAQSQRWIGFELNGFQCLDQIRMYRYEVQGAEA